MSTIDNRVVGMQFDNAAFQSKIATTLAALDSLSQKIATIGQTNGLQQVANTANAIDMSKMAGSVDHIANRFSALGAVAFTVIQDITRSVTGFATTMLKEDILGPIITGGKQRAQNIEQAKFMFEGLGIDAAKGLESAKEAVLGTAYGLGSAAKAASQFAASGIKVGDQMTGALRGVAGTAAMTGATFDEMAYIFTGVAGQGKLTNQDLMQFATRGLNAAAALAKQMGKTEDQVHEMARNGEIDFKTFAEGMDKAFGAHAKDANKTYAGSLANVKAALGRFGAAYYQVQQDQKRDVFNALIPVIDGVTKAFKPLVDSVLFFNRLSVDKFVNSLKGLDMGNLNKAMMNFALAFANMFASVHRFGQVIGQAFKQIFPASAGSLLLSVSSGLKTFSEHLKMGADTASKVKTMFTGFFSIFAIGAEVFKQFFHMVGTVLSVLPKFNIGFLAAGSSAGSFLTRLKYALVDGGKIQDFFIRLSEVLVNFVNRIHALGNKIAGFFTTVDKTVGGDNRVTSRLDSLRHAADRVGQAWDAITEKFREIGKALEPVWQYIKTWFSQLGQKIAQAFKPGDFDSTLDIINIGLLGGITVMLKKFFAGGIKFGFGGGLVNKMNVTLGSLTKSLNTMQTVLKSNVLLKIAGAIGILTLSIVALSLIDSEALTKALVAISVGFGELVGVMTLMDKAIGSSKDAFKIGILAGALIAMAVAMDLLAIAIAKLSRLSWAELTKGLTGVGVGLGLLVAAVKIIGSDTGGLIRASLGIVLISAALIVLQKAVEAFAQMKWADMAKGLTGVAVGLGAITLAMKFMPASGALSGFGFVEIAAGLRVLALAVAAFGKMSWEEIGKGLLGISLGLAAIAITMGKMPLNLPVTAAGVLILSVAMVGMAEAVKKMGEQNFGQLAKGLGAFAVTLGVLVLAMKFMEGSIAGATALVIVSGAMLIMTKVIQQLAMVKAGDLVKALVGLAATLTILGVAGALLEPAVPGMIAFGIAIAGIGAGFYLFGKGAEAVVHAFSLMGKVGKEGAKGIVDAIATISAAMPSVAGAFAKAIGQWAKDMTNAVPLIIRLFEALLSQLLETVINLTPLIAEAFGVIIVNACEIIQEQFPLLLQTGFQMLLTLLQGILDHIEDITTTVVQIVVGFVTALANNMPQIIGAGANLIIQFLNGLATKIGDIVAAGANLLVKFLDGVASNLGKVFGSMAGVIDAFVNALKDSGIIQKLIGAGATIINEVLRGLGEAVNPKDPKNNVVIVAADVAGKFIISLSAAIVKLADAGVTALIDFIRGMGDIVKTRSEEFGRAWGYAAACMVEGFGSALKGAIKGIIDEIVPSWANPVKKVIYSVFKIGSPSKLTYYVGQMLMEGFAKGIKDNINIPVSGMEEGTNQLTKSMVGIISRISDSLDTNMDFNPTITPVLDLTKVEASSKDIQSYLGAATITPQVSTVAARLISTTAQLGVQPQIVSEPSGPREVSFTQNITSPTALSTGDIYRSTKSQIALAKEELGIS